MCLTLLVSVLVKLPRVQTYLVRTTASILSNKLHTKVDVGSVNVVFFKTAEINNIYIEDQRHDTLLQLGQLKADISLFSLFGKKAELTLTEIDNTTIKIYRAHTSDDFNFSFIIKALASNDTTATKKVSKPFNFSVDNIELNNIKFDIRDENSEDEVTVKLKHGTLNFNKMNLALPMFDLKYAELDKADVVFNEFSYLYPPDTTKPDTGIVHINRKAFQLLCKKLKMVDCSFIMNQDTLKPTPGEFNPDHIAATSINMVINNGVFIKDTVTGQFGDLSAIERCGFTIKHLMANARVTPKQITLKNLFLETNNSEVKDYFQMNYHAFRAFTTNFSTEMHMKGNLKDCKVSFFDLAYFAPEVKNVIDKTILANGTITGTVNDLHGKDMKLQFASSGLFNGNIELKGLPDIEETFANLDIYSLEATRYDLKELLPFINLPDNIASLGLVKFRGNYTGFFNDFVAYGNFTTALGDAASDLNFKVDKHNHASYSGSFSAEDFNIGRFLNQDSILGTISFKGDIKGSGLRADNISTQMNGEVTQIVFNHYNYHNITVFGKFDRKEFNGNLNIDDKDLSLDFSGNVDFNDTIPKFNFIADITNAHLHALHFANKDFVLNSTVKLNFSGNTLDNAIGDVNIEHTIFTLFDKSYRIDSIHVTSSVNALVKTIKVKSDVLDAALTGDFYLDDFYDSFMAMMKHYFPSLPFNVTDQPVKQVLSFNFTARKIEPFTNFFFPEIKGLTGSYSSGTLNTFDRSITLTGLIPELDYKNFKFQNIDLSADVTKHDRLRVAANTKTMWLSDSMYIQNVDMSFAVRNDSALCHLKTADSSYANRVNLTGWVIGAPDSMKFSFFKSDFFLNNVEWTVPDNNSITYTHDHILINDLKINGPDAQIAFSGIKNNTANTLTAAFANIKIEDFYNLLKIQDYSMFGLLNGTLTVINPLQQYRITSDITVDNLRLNTDTLGNLAANMAIDTLQQTMGFNFSLKQNNSSANVIGKYSLYSDSGLNANINLSNVKLAIAQPFLTGFASNIKGVCNGVLQLKGTLSNPQLSGKVTVPSGEATIDYLKTHYNFYNETADFTNNLISLHEVTVYDMYKNEATLGGDIIHDHLTDFRLDLYMKTKNFLVLNTTLRDNDLFYGKAFGSGTVLFTGPLNDLEIDAEIKSEKNTVMSIPISGGQSITDRSFIKFITNKEAAEKNDSTPINNSNLKLNFDLDVTPDAQINIILDQTTGDIIKGNGNGNLRMEINTAGSFNMYGTYTIQSGSYTFTYKNFVNKRFTLDQGGTISWSGDPYKARINISALYTLKTSLSTLTATPSSDQQTASQTVPVNVVMNLTGSLLTPNIDFDIVVPDQASSFSDLALSRLQQIKQDKNELNKQVFALLITNNFIPEQNSTSSLVSASAITSLSEFFTNQLSNIFSSINNKTNVSLNYYTLSDVPGTTGTTNATNGKEFVAAVQQRMLNDRLTVSVGGNIDVNSTPASQNSNTNIAGDFDIDYLLTPDGRYTLKAFRKNQYDDIAQQNISITGVGISYKKEFNKFKEIFQRTKNEK